MRVLLLIGIVLALEAAPAAAEELGVSMQGSPARVAPFAVDRPATPLSGPTAITGVSGPEVPAAIDFRPATGELYLYAVKPVSSQTGRLYKVDPITGVATAVGAAQNVVGDLWDIDFDPVSGQLRVMGTDFPGYAAVETHRRLNPDTGAKIADDTQPAFVPGDPSTFKGLGGGAYTNSVPGAARTTMF